MDPVALGNVLVTGGGLLAWLLSQTTSKSRALRREVRLLRMQNRAWRERDLAWEALIYDLDRAAIQEGRTRIALPTALGHAALDRILAITEDDE